MKQFITNFYHFVIKGQMRCPKCGKWCDCWGHIPLTHRNEYKCKDCNLFF